MTTNAVIEDFITEQVQKASHLSYREPIFGYARADDPMFLQLREVASEGHLLPSDLLPGAKSVFAFFLPYPKDLVIGNREGAQATKEWAEAYYNTNKLINEISRQLHDVLAEQGIKMAWLLPTYEFDKQQLVAQWSHKHVAHICGLGLFGRNHMLITKSGCAGRFGTAVLDIDLEPSTRPTVSHSCLGDTGCDYCQKACPPQALQPGAYDRHKCYEQCIANERLFPQFQTGTAEVCGKCATGPCGCME